jgi:hypothetical protein
VVVNLDGGLTRQERIQTTETYYESAAHWNYPNLKFYRREKTTKRGFRSLGSNLTLQIIHFSLLVCLLHKLPRIPFLTLMVSRYEVDGKQIEKKMATRKQGTVSIMYQYLITYYVGTRISQVQNFLSENFLLMNENIHK